MNTPVQILPVSEGTVLASTRGTTVATGSSPATLGSKVELDASLAYDACGFWLFRSGVSGVTEPCEAKVYVGGSGSETEIVHVGLSTESYFAVPVYCPIAIPAGSRVSAATSANGTWSSQNIYLSFLPVRGRSFDPLVSRGRLYGASSGEYTYVDAGGTANTKSSWVQIASSTTENAKGYTLILGGDTSASADAQFLFDIGVGSAGNEQIILADFPAAGIAYRTCIVPATVGPIWTPIPSGTRLAARCSCSTTTASARVPQVAIILWE